MSQVINAKVSPPVARFTIDNPPLNVLSLEVRRALLENFRRICSNPSIKVIILEGLGRRAFSAGSDISEFPPDREGGMAKIRFEQMMLDAIFHAPQIVIAKLDGYVLGGGAALMLVCDLRIATRESLFGFPEIKIGAFPAGGGTHLLAREIGLVRAKQLVLLGDSIDAECALELGLVNMVVDHDDLAPTVEDIAGRLGAYSSIALTEAKKALNAGVTASFEEGQTAEAVGFGRLYDRPDLLEGVAAFIEKRKPQFE